MNLKQLNTLIEDCERRLKDGPSFERVKGGRRALYDARVESWKLSLVGFLNHLYWVSWKYRYELENDLV